MSRIDFEPAARRYLSDRFKTDPAGVQQVLDSVNLLPKHPRPDGAFAMGSDRFRIRIGFYRVIYVVKQHKPVVLLVEHVGHANRP